MSTKAPELLDTITYENDNRVQVTIKLYKLTKKLYQVHLHIGNVNTIRSFYTEKQASDHIIALQRGTVPSYHTGRIN